MMTCFTPSPTSSNHVHFIDGAMGGYAMAASAMKASAVDGLTPRRTLARHSFACSASECVRSDLTWQ